MKLRRQERKSSTVVFEEIEPFCLGLLHELPADADPGDHPAARGRLYGAPMADAEDGDEFNDDWKNFVQPEIHDLFRSAQEIVSSDLEKLPPSGLPPAPADDGAEEAVFNPAAFVPTSHTLEIPVRHAEAWLSVLNQARLVIAAKRGFEEAAMDEELPFPPLSARSRDLFKVHFYDFVQHVLLRELGYD